MQGTDGTAYPAETLQLLIDETDPVVTGVHPEIDGAAVIRQGAEGQAVNGYGDCQRYGKKNWK